MRFLLIGLLFAISTNSYACKLLKYDTTKLSDKRVLVQGVFTHGHKTVLIEVFNGDMIVGRANTTTSSNGSFIIKVGTLKNVDLFPRIKGFCLN
nr:hypothetical protein 13 [Piscirickettsiaceae bacterium]